MHRSGEELRRVVVRFLDGRLMKGTTLDFSPQKPKFHLYEGGDENAPAVAIALREIKALFFVKDFEGDSGHVANYDFAAVSEQGRRIAVTFKDGELIAGLTMGYSPDKPGFFMIPADPASNNARIFINREAVKKVEWVAVAPAAASAVPS